MLYVPLVGWTLLGWVLGRLMPLATPAYLGKFLFWVGVPVGIVAFLRHAEVSWSLWLAPVVAWAAILSGLGLSMCLTAIGRYHPQIPGNGPDNPVFAWLTKFFDFPFLNTQHWNKRTQGSFLLASMVGNTGYIGFPVSLALVGPHYFAWALFYDLLGSTPGAYGLGVALASRFGGTTSQNSWQPFLAVIKNPALWSFAIGLIYRDLPLPISVETSLRGFAWSVVALSLVLVGMRLSRLSSLKSIQPSLLSLVTKMLLVPLVLGIVLKALGIGGLVHRAILLQMSMPPAFATLVIAEAYGLDQEMAVTALVAGCLGLLIMLPVWLWLFSV